MAGKATPEDIKAMRERQASLPRKYGSKGLLAIKAEERKKKSQASLAKTLGSTRGLSASQRIAQSQAPRGTRAKAQTKPATSRRAGKK